MRRIALSRPEPQPFSALNTTPLIDVLLVLLVMFIITIPMQVHELPVNLPGTSGVPATPPPVRRLEIGQAGNLSWDGVPIATDALGAKLAAFRADPAQPVLLIRADGEVRYDAFARTLSMVKEAGITRLSFSGNERF
jgi:biopolymer transport protein ExbD